MRTQLTLDYPASRDRVLEVFANPDFYRQRVSDAFPEGAGTLSQCAVEVAASPTQIRAVTVVTLNLEGLSLPPAAAKFLPAKGVSLRLEETWELAVGNGRLEVSVADLPVQAQAESQLVEVDSSIVNSSVDTGLSFTRRVSDVEIKVSIPFFGKKIEETLVTNLESVIRAENTTFQKFI